MDKSAPTLDELRRRLDAIDDRIHDRVMERAGVIERIAALKQTTGQPSFRPGRVAEILRRQMARHAGPFPRQSLVRLWCELLSGSIAMQGPFTVAVPETSPGQWDMARDYFGGHVPMVAFRSPAEVLNAVAEGRVQAGVLPMPTADDPAPWWSALAARRGDGPRIVARLPLATRGNARGSGDAVVIGAEEADPTGDDCTLLAIQAAKTVKPPRLVAALEGIDPRVRHIATHEAAAGIWCLVEFDGTVTADDPRLVAAFRALSGTAPTAWPLGSYARPLPRENK